MSDLKYHKLNATNINAMIITVCTMTYLIVYNVSFRVMVKMKNLLNGNTWLWERGKFMNRRYLIQVTII